MERLSSKGFSSLGIARSQQLNIATGAEDGYRVPNAIGDVKQCA
jgi:hypothetical protein